jgi:hypothetical protein
MLDERAIDELLVHLDVRRLGMCDACLCHAAFAMKDGESRRTVAGAVTTAANWSYPEIEETLDAALRRLRMAGVEAAEDALADLAERGWRSRLVRRIVERRCAEMVEEMSSGEVLGEVRMRRLSLVPDDP